MPFGWAVVTIGNRQHEGMERGRQRVNNATQTVLPSSTHGVWAGVTRAPNHHPRMCTTQYALNRTTYRSRGPRASYLLLLYWCTMCRSLIFCLGVNSRSSRSRMRLNRCTGVSTGATTAESFDVFSVENARMKVLLVPAARTWWVNWWRTRSIVNVQRRSRTREDQLLKLPSPLH